MGYIPNYSPNYTRDNDQQNHWENGVHYFQTHPYTENCFDIMSIYTHFTYIYDDKHVCVYILLSLVILHLFFYYYYYHYYY